MSAASTLRAAREASVRLRVDGDALVLEAASAPQADLLDRLARHKAEIIALIRPAEDGWSAEDWQAFFDERAAIGEFDGGLDRAEAEARAFDRCVAAWLGQHPEPSRAGGCVVCGWGDLPHDPLLPQGRAASDVARLHACCRLAHDASRRAAAVAALADMGIAPRAKSAPDFGKIGGG